MIIYIIGIELNCISTIKEVLSNISVLQKKIIIRPHPGYAYNLACDSWKASDCKGHVYSWSAYPYIRWYHL